MSETLKETIERMKKNERGWAFLSENDRQCIQIANSHGKIERLTFTGGWGNLKTGFNLSNVGGFEIYRIRPDYQPEPPKPEYIDFPIEEDGLWLGVRDEKSLLVYGFCHVHWLPSLLGFEGFCLAGDKKGHEHYITFESVSRCHRQGKVVVARFEKGIKE